MAYNEIEDLVILFFTGEISEKEKARLRSWLDESEEHRRYFDLQKELWTSAMSASEQSAFAPEKGFAAFAARKSDFEKMSHRRRSMRGSVRYVIAAVAAVCIVLGGGAVYRNSTRKEVKEIYVQAPLASTVSCTLPDGSSVSLNAGSRLSYNSDFGKFHRIVKLDGEAYFDVHHDTKRLFIVKTDRLEITDLGTSFNIRNYSGDAEAQIALVQGKVAFSVSNGVSNVEMRPGEVANLDKDNGYTSIKSGKIESAISWISGCYLFENEKLSSIVKKLERGFEVTINISNDSLGELRFNGCFDSGTDDMDSILNSLAGTGKIRVDKQQKGIYNIY